MIPSRPAVLARVAGAALLLACAGVCAQPAFPGAEGFGAAATGGRGGAVIKVTNLNASGPGSLQAAVSTPGPRIVVFAVSGVIDGDLRIPHGDLTIAGQTAPGAGITIHGHVYTPYPTTFGNIVLRFLRVRPPMPDADWPAARHDAVQMSANRLLMFDHLDLSHGVDEILDLYEGARDITLQWSIVSFPVQGGGHPDGANHHFGMLNGPGGGRISVLNNLFAHNLRRTPALSYGPAEVINNVVYNAREAFVHNNPADGAFNLIGNTYRDGPSANLLPFFFDPENPSTPPVQYHLADNRVDHPGVFSGLVGNPFANAAFRTAYPGFYCCGIAASMFAAGAPFDFSANSGWRRPTVRGADAAYACVLARAGAWPRDLIARRAVQETTQRNGAWGNVRPPNWLTDGLVPQPAPPDGDGDGMPDAWELANGLNPGSASDVHQPMPGGYPAIETYLAALAQQLIGGGGGGGAPDTVFAAGFEPAAAPGGTACP